MKQPLLQSSAASQPPPPTKYLISETQPRIITYGTNGKKGTFKYDLPLKTLYKPFAGEKEVFTWHGLLFGWLLLEI